LNITLLNVNKTTKSDKNGKPYQIAELAYKNNTYDGKVEGFKVTSFMGAYKDIVDAAPGTTFEVKVEKKGQFNEWVSAQSAVPGASSPVQSKAGDSQPKASYAPAGKLGGNTYSRDFETREERAKKQVYIVRQSAISSAIAALSVGAKAPMKTDDVLEVAKRFEAYVFEQQKLGGETGFDDVPDLDPTFDTNS
jgi:hypothetical protein